MLYTFSGAAALDWSCSFKHGAHQDSVHEPQREKLPPPILSANPRSSSRRWWGGRWRLLPPHAALSRSAPLWVWLKECHVVHRGRRSFSCSPLQRREEERDFSLGCISFFKRTYYRLGSEWGYFSWPWTFFFFPPPILLYPHPIQLKDRHREKGTDRGRAQWSTRCVRFNREEMCFGLRGRSQRLWSVNETHESAGLSAWRQRGGKELAQRMMNEGRNQT